MCNSQPFRANTNQKSGIFQTFGKKTILPPRPNLSNAQPSPGEEYVRGDSVDKPKGHVRKEVSNEDRNSSVVRTQINRNERDKTPSRPVKPRHRQTTLGSTPTAGSTPASEIMINKSLMPVQYDVCITPNNSDPARTNTQKVFS